MTMGDNGRQTEDTKAKATEFLKSKDFNSLECITRNFCLSFRAIKTEKVFKCQVTLRNHFIRNVSLEGCFKLALSRKNILQTTLHMEDLLKAQLYSSKFQDKIIYKAVGLLKVVVTKKVYREKENEYSLKIVSHGYLNQIYFSSCHLVLVKKEDILNECNKLDRYTTCQICLDGTSKHRYLTSRT